MSVPSVKGLLVISSVASIQTALESGRLSRDVLDARLEAADLALLEDKLDPTRWYPLASLGRMTELLAAMKGGDRAATLREMGWNAAEAVRAAGTYAQMGFEEGSLAEASAYEQKSFARQAATIQNLLFNFGRTSVEVDADSDEILVHYEDMAGFPEATRLTSEGYTSRMATWALGRPCTIRVERVEHDRFTFRFCDAD